MTNQNNDFKTINFKLPVSYKLDIVNCNIFENSVDIELKLTTGAHVFTINSIKIGTFNDIDILADISFNYEFDEEENKLTIYGNDDKTHRQLVINTYLFELGKSNLEQAISSPFNHVRNEFKSHLSDSDLWTNFVLTNSEIKDGFAKICNECNEIITKEAISQGVTSVLSIGTPPIVTLENIEDFKQMYGERVVSTLQEGRLAQINQMQFVVNSTYVGTVTWSQAVYFANVIGSTNDPKPSGVTSWLGLWRDKCNGGHNTDTCSSYNWFSLNTTWKCSTVFVGGHVITGTAAKYMSKNSTVYIFPICNVHNGSDPNYMKSLYNPVGVQLKYW